MGYVMKRSLPSLVAGAGCGGVLLGLEYLIMKYPDVKTSFSLTQAGISLAVSAFMLSSYYKSETPRTLAIGTVSFAAFLGYALRAFPLQKKD